MATVNSPGTGCGPGFECGWRARLLHRRDMRVREHQPIGAVGIGAGGEPHFDDRSLPAPRREQRVQLGRGQLRQQCGRLNDQQQGHNVRANRRAG